MSLPIGAPPPSGARPRGRFLVLVGIDGSGKSTLLSRLADTGVRTASWQELRSHEVPATLAPDAPTTIKNRLTPLARAMFIGGHLVAQYEYLVRPNIEAGIDTILDSYYYKLLSKERLLGYSHPALEQLCAELPQPDGVIFLHVDPGESYRRKDGSLSPYEHFGAGTQNSYVEFQSKLESALRSAVDGRRHVVLDGRSAPDVLLAAALDAVETLSDSGRAE